MAKIPKLNMRAIVTETDGGFAVGVSTTSLETDPEILADEIVPTLDAAHAVIIRVAEEHNISFAKIKKFYVTGSGITAHPPNSSRTSRH